MTAAALGCAAFSAPTALAAISAVSNDAAGATAIGGAIVASPGTLNGASFDAVPSVGTPNGTADAPLSVFPTSSSTFGILTSGDVQLADDENLYGTSGDALGGSSVRGDSDYDVTVLKLDLTAPAATNCLGLDFAFYSEEYPEWVGSSFNDAFIAELDSSTWTTSGSTITAPNNFAFDTSNDVVSINSTGATAMSPANAAGTTYDGATTLLKASAPTTPGSHTLYLTIFDQGDHDLDSAVFLDNVRFLNVENPATDCAEGATPVAKATSTTYTGDASVQYSDAVTLSGTLRDTSVTPDIGIAGKQLDFTLGTQTTSAAPTDANGNTSAPPLTVTQKPGTVSSVEAAFAGDGTYAASQDSKPFSITKEDCTLGYSGDTQVAPATNTTLAASLGEPDTSLGDLSGKTVTFTVTDAANNVQTFSATTDAGGHASTSKPLGSDVYGVSVAFAGDDYHKSCSTPADTLVTVQAAGSKVTGGGWISISTGRTSFGFNAIPEAGGLFKGQFQLRANNGKNRFHGKVVSTLSGSGNAATWSGTGFWNGQPGYRYTISVVDNGSSGSKKADTISVTIRNSSNAIVYSTGSSQTLKGGNITVH